MIKEYNINQDIGHFKGFFDKELCENLILFFNEMKKINLTFSREFKDNAVTDDSTNILFPVEQKVLNNVNNEEHLNLKIRKYDQFTNNFLNIFWNEIYQKYADKYVTLRNIKNHMIYDMKIQKTPLEGGFHRWHCEKASKETAQRIMVFMLYLNTVDSGGETEFLHQKVKFKPVQGDFLLWPSGYTHTHRGDPPFSNEKYIVTGWVEFT